MTKVCFTEKEIEIIREMMFVGSSTPGIEVYQYGYESTEKKYKESQKILKKLGFEIEEE